MFEEVTASNLLKYDYDGNPLTAGAPKLKGGGLIIHAGLLKERTDVNVVFHTHTEANMGVSSQKWGLLTVNQHAMRFHNRIAYHEFKGFEFNLFMRDPLLKDIEAAAAAPPVKPRLAGAGATIPEAFVMHHFLEFACRGQIAALSAGYENLNFPDEEAREFAANQVRAEGEARWWQGLARLPTHGRSPIPRIRGTTTAADGTPSAARPVRKISPFSREAEPFPGGESASPLHQLP